MTNNSASAGRGDLRLPRPKGVKTHQGQGMGRDTGRNTVGFARTPNDGRRAMVNFQRQRKGTSEHATGPVSVHILPGLS